MPAGKPRRIRPRGDTVLQFLTTSTLLHVLVAATVALAVMALALYHVGRR